MIDKRVSHAKSRAKNMGKSSEVETSMMCWRTEQREGHW